MSKHTMNERERTDRFRQAQRLYQSGYRQEALDILDELAMAAPRNADILYARALALASTDRAYEALQVCNRLVHEFHDQRGEALKAGLKAAKQPKPVAPELDAAPPTPAELPRGTARNWRLRNGLILALGVGVPLLVALYAAAGLLGDLARRYTPASPQAEAAATANTRGIAVLASSIGTDYPAQELLRFLEQGNFSPVVVDWAWITHHWNRTRFEDVNTVVKGLVRRGVPVAAMFRPRFLDSPTVPTQVSANGANAFEHGYEINYRDAAARRWGIEWGTQILRQCPDFEEIILYNPRNIDRSAASLRAEQGNPTAAVDAVWQFVREARDTWRKQKPGLRVGVTAPPDPDFWSRGADAYDSAHPLLSVRDDLDLNDELGRWIALQEKTGGKSAAAFAKVTWEEGYRVNPGKANEFEVLARERGLSYCLWELGSLTDPALYPPAEAARMLQVDPVSLNALRPAAGASATGRSIAPDRVSAMLARIDEGRTNEENTEHIQELADLARGADATSRTMIVDAVSAVARGQSYRQGQRWLCCYVLAEIRDERSVETLGEVLQRDPLPLVRGVAACALAAFDAEKARTVLERAQRNERDPEVLKWIQDTLVKLSSGAAPRPSSTPEPEPALTAPKPEARPAKLPWPHQAPGTNAPEAERLGKDLWVINNFPLYQAENDGTRRYIHGGFDIVLPNGTKIYAMEDGWVKSVADTSVIVADAPRDAPSYGWMYTHLGNVQVSPGQQVKRGAWLGEVQFQGLEHVHLVRVFSEGSHWGKWHYVCAPDAHFAVADEDPPVIATPFHFFRAGSDTQFPADGAKRATVSGDVDLVVGMRDGGAHAHSADNGFGDRLAVARIEYAVAPKTSPAQARRFASFDFSRLAIKESTHDRGFDDRMARFLFKHWGLFEPAERDGNGVLSYYILKTYEGEQPVEPSAPGWGCSWHTAARGGDGKPQFPDGEYVVTVTAWDYAGNRAEAATEVVVANEAR